MRWRPFPLLRVHDTCEGNEGAREKGWDGHLRYTRRGGTPPQADWPRADPGRRRDSWVPDGAMLSPSRVWPGNLMYRARWELAVVGEE